MSRQIVLVALSETRIDGHQVVEGFYELQGSDRLTFKSWYGIVRDQHPFVHITTNDRLNELDIRLERPGVSVIKSLEVLARR